MRRWTCFAVGAALGLAVVAQTAHCWAAEVQKAEPGKQEPQKLDRTIRVTMDYLLYLPKDYAQKDSWPLMLFLHGAGERGDDLNRVKLHGQIGRAHV
mgnify:FL=1